MNAPNAYADILRRIISVAPRKLGNQLSCQHHAAPHAVPTLSLPLPKDKTEVLLQMGLPSTIASELSQRVLSTAKRIRSDYEKAHKAKIDEVADHLRVDPGLLPSFQKMLSSIEKKYQEDIADLEAKFLQRAAALGQKASTRPAFNQDFAPLLEQVFEYFPYPDASHRLILARKTRMTTRQIDVWFQNHRTRSKKEGKRLNRQSMDVCSLERLMKSPTFLSPPTNSSPVGKQTSSDKEHDSPRPTLLETKTSQDSSCLTPPPATEGFCSVAPAHAFPTQYPPQRYGHNPFPTRSGNYTFPAPTWYRLASRACPTNEVQNSKLVDMDHLCVEFSKLHLRGNVNANPTPSIIPWLASFATIASLAPHPSLVQTVDHRQRQLNVPGLRPIRTISPQRQRAHVFGSSTPLTRHSPYKLLKRTKRTTRTISQRPFEGAPFPSSKERLASLSPSSSVSDLSDSSSMGGCKRSSRSRSSSSSSSSAASSTLQTPITQDVPLPHLDMPHLASPQKVPHSPSDVVGQGNHDYVFSLSRSLDDRSIPPRYYLGEF